MRLLQRGLIAVSLSGAIVGAGDADAVERVERGNLVLEGVPEVPERISERLRQYRNVRSADLEGWLADGSGVLVSTRFGETPQLHQVEEPGAARRQLTFFTEPVYGASPRPDADRPGFVFPKDVGGSEYYQLFYFDRQTGEHRMLTDGESRNGGALWSNSGDKLVYYSTRRNGKDWDLWVQDMTNPDSTPEAVLKEGGVWFPADWSPSDDRILAARYVSANEVHPHILDLASGELDPVGPQGENVAYSAMAFAADGKGVYYATDAESELKRLYYEDLSSGERSVLTGDIDWNVTEIEVSDDGQYLAFTVNREGISDLHVIDLERDERVDVPDIPMGIVGGLSFAPDNRRLGLTINRPVSPSDVYSLDMDSKEITRWTESEIGGLNPERFVEPEVVRYPTFDKLDGERRTIPSFYYRPRGEGPHPVIVDIHGGPESQERPGFNSLIQYWVNEMGAAVLTPNVRGSAGYGKTYLKLDNGFKREDSVKDIGALLDWIEQREELNAERVAVYGGSYGGYMVLSSMFHYDDRLRAGVDIVGISNFVTFLENTEEYRRDLRRPEYGDERDPEMRDFLERISPTNHADEINKPLFVIQGANDPRVPQSESEQMVAEIRENGGKVWYMLAKNEGHGFSKKSNRDAMLNAIALFLERHLLHTDE